MSARWPQVEELFAAACERPTAERAAFVSAASVDREVADEVLSLLSAADEATVSIDGIVGSQVATFVRPERRRIGPYRIDDVLGEGGMGVVYAATRADGQFSQRVALKVLKHGIAADRFRDERQILATLAHPNIVKLLDGGTTDDGQPYLVMERVDGSPITAMTGERALRLFRDVCAAVHHAHGAGVIHRDLKPSNILVDGHGDAKLLDFGIAKLSGDREARTRTGAAMMTPEYASPEQLRGEAATNASDVYALGAVLYELIATRPPRRGTFAELLALPPIVPPKGPRDLANIAMTALADEPGRRYASVEALGDDVGRYLAGLPVHARGAGRLYRAGKLARRHRGRLALATVALVGAAATWRLWPGAAWQPAIEPVRWSVEDDGSFPAALSPDGTQLAFTSMLAGAADQRLIVMPARGGEFRVLRTNVDATPRWTRDGRALLVIEHDRLERLDLASGHTDDLGAPGEVDDCGGVIVRVVDRADGQRVELLRDGAWRERLRLGSPTRDFESSIRCDPRTGRLLLVRGASFATACVGDLDLIEPDGRVTAIVHDHTICSATFGAGGRSAVYAANRGGIVNLYERALDGGDEHRITTGPGPDMWPEVSADDSTLTYAIDPELMTLLIGDDRTHQELHLQRSAISEMVATRDGAFYVVERNEPYGGGEQIETIAATDHAERVITDGVLPFPSFDSTRVFFQVRDRGSELRVVPISGGASALVARLPGAIALGVDGPDATHVLIERDGRFEGWRVGRDGATARENDHGLVIPAPTGGWRAIQIPERDYRLELWGPGATSPAHTLHVTSPYTVWLDDHRLAAAIGDRFVIVDATGDETPLAPPWLAQYPTNPLHALAAIAPDGLHAAAAIGSGKPTRQLITNFGTRPSRP